MKSMKREGLKINIGEFYCWCFGVTRIQFFHLWLFKSTSIRLTLSLRGFFIFSYLYNSIKNTMFMLFNFIKPFSLYEILFFPQQPRVTLEGLKKIKRHKHHRKKNEKREDFRLLLMPSKSFLDIIFIAQFRRIKFQLEF